jgi:hypothetical protein
VLPLGGYFDLGHLCHDKPSKIKKELGLELSIITSLRVPLKQI